MSESTEHLTRLLAQQLSTLGSSDAKLGELFGVNWKTVFNWRNGKSVPTPATRAGVEKAIGWKLGSIDRILAGPGPFGSLESLESVQDLPADKKPVKRASELSDDELLSEVTRRFKNYADKANDGPAQTPAQGRWEDYGLAARKEKLVRRPPKN